MSDSFPKYYHFIDICGYSTVVKALSNDMWWWDSRGKYTNMVSLRPVVTDAALLEIYPERTEISRDQAEALVRIWGGQFE